MLVKTPMDQGANGMDETFQEQTTKRDETLDRNIWF
jgi:hypothetical protein